MDAAIAGFLGAIVGGAATFGGTVVSNSQQAGRERKKENKQRKVEAYSNSIRSLIRVAHRRSTFSAKTSDALGEEIVASWFDDIVDAEYWLTILTAACGSRHRESIQKAAQALFEEIDRFRRESEFADAIGPTRAPLLAVFSAYRVVSEAARGDIGFTE